MRGRLEPKDTVERFWGLKFIGFPNLSDETPKPRHPAAQLYFLGGGYIGPPRNCSKIHTGLPRGIQRRNVCLCSHLASLSLPLAAAAIAL